MAHHEIQVLLIEDPPGSNNRFPVPQIPPPGVIRVDDTVSYTSEIGDVTIEFELPFSETKDVIRPGQIQTLTRAGNFFCKCYLVRRSDGEKFGWSPQTPKAGGEHDVRP
jgi:hypothetical protein